MAQNNKSGTSSNISDSSLKEIPFSAVITKEDYQIQILEGDGESLNYISGYKLSLTSSEKNIKNIKSVIWRQNYGTPVDVYQEDLNYIFTTVDSSSVKITAEVTPYIGEKYFTSIVLKGNENDDMPIFPDTCTPSFFTQSLPSLEIENYYLAYEFIFNNQDINYSGQVSVLSSEIIDNQHSIATMVLSLFEKIDTPEYYLNDYFNINAPSTELIIEGLSQNNYSPENGYQIFSESVTFRIVSGFGDPNEIDFGLYLLNQMDATFLELHSCGKKIFT